MGYNKSEKVRIKFEFLRLLLKLELDPARQTLVAGIFENYHTLNIEEEHELNEQLCEMRKRLGSFDKCWRLTIKRRFFASAW